MKQPSGKISQILIDLRRWLVLGFHSIIHEIQNDQVVIRDKLVRYFAIKKLDMEECGKCLQRS